MKFKEAWNYTHEILCAILSDEIQSFPPLSLHWKNYLVSFYKNTSNENEIPTTIKWNV